MGKKEAASAAENIKVLVRCRPLSEKEKGHGHKSCVDLDLTAQTVTVRSLVGEPDRWTFDGVINNTFSQRDVFTQFVLPLVESVLEGFNATVFAYGQSGSGKTHTMTGVMGNSELEGIIPRCIQHIFSRAKESKDAATVTTYSMYVSFVELYNGKVRDLLAKQQVTLDVREAKDHTFFVQGATVPQVKFPEDILRLMEEGTERRRTASTELNADSSRSHSLFTLLIERTETAEDGTVTSVSSKLNLVDLAGSERQSKTGASGDTLKEGCNINLSLSALGTVIDTIVKGGKHIPFRSSPLTMLLKDSLGGNSKTVMFANINPSEHNLSETVSTLRFADRAKQIKNKPVVNMDAKDQKIAELTQIIQELREKLQRYETEGTESLEAELEKLREQVGDLEVNLDNAVKGREADKVDAENAQAKLIAERQAFNSRIVEMEDQVAQLQNDLQIAEASAASERTQREEVLQMCSAYLQNGAEPQEGGATTVPVITNTEDLTALFKDRAHGANSAELAQLQTQVQTLTAENTTLTRELAEMQRTLQDLREESKEALARAETRAKKLKKELQTARAATATAPTGSTMDATMAFPDGGAAASGAGSLKAAADGVQQNTIHPSPVNGGGAVAALPAVTAELEGLKAELDEMKAQRTAVEESRDRLLEELQEKRKEIGEAERRAAELEGKMNEQRRGYERKLAEAQSGGEDLVRAERRLREKADQLEQMRTLLEKQKSLIVKSNEKNEYFQQKLKEANASAEEIQQRYKEMLEEKDASVQRLINTRLEQYAAERQQELETKTHTQKKFKKKYVKLQASMEELQQEFDKKVCECEDLRNTLAEARLEQLKLARRLQLTAEEADVIEQKEQIQGSLERAREDRKRREDLFALGGVQSVKTATGGRRAPSITPSIQ